MPVGLENLKLTDYSTCGGCAAKMDPTGLARVLAGLPRPSDERLLVGYATADDAAVYKLSPDMALVLTVDFTTPIADDPYEFGQIGAANSLSDVYAMGGRPIAALAVVCFPTKELDLEVLEAMLRGGADKAAEAGVLVVGGHSIDDREVKYGLSVTGLVHPDRAVRNSTARPGDALFLTKPLGTGIVTSAIRQGKLARSDAAAAFLSMTTLNAAAAGAMLEIGVNAATDITGFGLMGHGMEMGSGSGVTVEFEAASIPVFEEALHFAAKGVMTGADARNRHYVDGKLEVGHGVDPVRMSVFFDPQTSGGLLISVPAERADELGRRLASVGAGAARVGTVLAGTGPAVRVV